MTDTPCDCGDVDLLPGVASTELRGMVHGRGVCRLAASPQPDTAPSALEEACSVLDAAFPGVDLGDVSDVLAALPAGVLRRLADAAEDMVDPQPDTAPKGPWTAENPTSATLWPSPLNGAPATPPENMCVCSAHRSHALCGSDEYRCPCGGAAATPAEWPKWLTPEHTNIHTAIENAMKQALAHCYGSADASGYAWTMEGLFSVAANSIMGMLRDAGCPPPAVGDVEALPMPEDTWLVDEDESDEEALDAVARLRSERNKNDG